MVSMVGSSGTLDILRVKSVGFLDSLKVECERKEGNKIPQFYEATHFLFFLSQLNWLFDISD